LKPILNTLGFEVVDHLARLTRLRDRMRCPKCEAVGTWKPHGGWADRKDDLRHVRRWLCKWCGYYVGTDGVKQCGIGGEIEFQGESVRVWAFEGPTPASVIAESSIPGAWPWRG